MRTIRDWDGDAEIGTSGLPEREVPGLWLHNKTVVLQESASHFSPLKVTRKCRLYVPKQQRILRAVRWPLEDGGAQLIARGEVNTSVYGVLDLYAAGMWGINTPIVVAEGTQVLAKLADVAFLDPETAATLTLPGSVPQTPTFVNVTDAGVNILGADPGRGAYALTNPHATERVWLAFGGETPVVGRGEFVSAGGVFAIEHKPGEPSKVDKAVKGITASGVTVALAVQVWK